MLQELEQECIKRLWRLVALRALSEGAEPPKEHRTVELASVAMVWKMCPNLVGELVHRLVPYDAGRPEQDGWIDGGICCHNISTDQGAVYHGSPPIFPKHGRLETLRRRNLYAEAR